MVNDHNRQKIMPADDSWAGHRKTFAQTQCQLKLHANRRFGVLL
jgi:hypothetical protein